MDQLGKALCLAPQTIHNRIAKGEFKVPTYVDGAKRCSPMKNLLVFRNLRQKLRRYGLAGCVVLSLAPLKGSL